MKFQPWQDDANAWRWRVCTPRGRVVLEGGTAFATEAELARELRRLVAQRESLAQALTEGAQRLEDRAAARRRLEREQAKKAGAAAPPGAAQASPGPEPAGGAIEAAA